MVRERADEAAVRAEAIVTGIEKECCSDEAGGNASGLAAVGVLFVAPTPPPTFDDDDDCPNEVNESEAEEEAPAPAVAVSGRRSCHANDGVRSISDDRTPERVRVVKVGGSDEKAAKEDDDDGDADDENENAELFAAWRGVDDRV